MSTKTSIENELLHIIITETFQVWMGIWGLDGFLKLHGKFQHSEVCILSVNLGKITVYIFFGWKMGNNPRAGKM